MKYAIGTILMGSDPLITRTIYVDSKMPMKRFTNLIMAIYGMENLHLHQYAIFSADEKIDIMSDIDLIRASCDPSREKMTSKEVYLALDIEDPHYMFENDSKVADVFSDDGSGAIMTYDFGDTWQILMIKDNSGFDQLGNEEFGYIGGSGEGIIEDCGGVSELNRIRQGERKSRRTAAKKRNTSHKR